MAFQTEFESLIRAIPYDGVADKLRHTLAEEIQIRGGLLPDGNFAAGTLPAKNLYSARTARRKCWASIAVLNTQQVPNLDTHSLLFKEYQKPR